MCYSHYRTALNRSLQQSCHPLPNLIRKIQKPDTHKPNTQKPHTQKPHTQKPHTRKPNTQTPDTQTPNMQHGLTALMGSTMKSHLNVVKALLERKAAVDLANPVREWVAGSESKG